MAQNPYQPYSAYQQAQQYGPYQNMYLWPGQPMQAQMPAYGSQTPNTGIQKPPAMSGRVVCQEARYYESVSRAMESYGENPRMGYNPNRDSRGRYSRGYTGPVTYADPSDDPTPDGQRINHRFVDDRPGYMPMSMVPSERMRYDQRDMDEEYDPRYGRTFNDYRRAKRHYTETHSDSDRQKMRDKTNEHVMETMATMREMFDDADPELKKRMKADMVKLTQEMSV